MRLHYSSEGGCRAKGQNPVNNPINRFMKTRQKINAVGTAVLLPLAPNSVQQHKYTSSCYGRVAHLPTSRNSEIYATTALYHSTPGCFTWSMLYPSRIFHKFSFRIRNHFAAGSKRRVRQAHAANSKASEARTVSCRNSYIQRIHVSDTLRHFYCLHTTCLLYTSPSPRDS